MKKTNRTILIIVAVAVVISMVLVMPQAALKANNGQTDSGDTAQQEVTIDQQENGNTETPSETGNSEEIELSGDQPAGQEEELQTGVDETGASDDAEAPEETPGDASGVKEDQKQEENTAGQSSKKAVRKAPVDFGAFQVSVEGEDDPEEYAEYSGGVLTIKKTDKTITVKNKESAAASDRIVISGNATVVLDGVNIAAAGGPAIKADPGVKATLVLKEGSKNTVAGASGYAGIEAGYSYDGSQTVLADLTIKGEGDLDAKGGKDSAGIGGSYNGSSKETKTAVYYGNITIDAKGNIEATGNGGGAGIGSSGNNGGSGGSFKVDNKDWGTITINNGNIDATGSNSAGIGGGNHVDSGKVIINGGTIDARGGSGIGCGTGSSKNKGNDADKGPGYYYSDITINGGTISARATGDDNWGGAGIGGGAYCDAKVVINGGNITAYGGSCGSGHNSLHHGGAAVGGGYEGHGDITITGGTVNAYVGGASSAAAIGSGGTPNSNQDRGTNGRSTVEGVTYLSSTAVTISGGTVNAYADQGRGGAGIGGGVSADKVSVNISGGTVTAYGAPSDKEGKQGGAGIGGGLMGAGQTVPGTTKKESSSYHVETAVSVSVTGGSVKATGGWGASGIGSGASNKTAESITIDAAKADVKAFADGTKFAVDTKDGTLKPDMTGDMLQGTFVYTYEDEGIKQDTERFNSLIVTSDADESVRINLEKPTGYRSFATSVSAPGNYTVYTSEEEIGEGGGRYFSICATETYDRDKVTDTGVKYKVTTGELSDNFFLFPVKTIGVTKSVKTEGALDKDEISMTLYFALQERDDKEAGELVKKDGEIWIESIEVKNGAPEGKAYFTDVPDGHYDVLEVNADGTKMEEGTVFGSIELRKIETQHEDGSDNNADIGPEKMTEEITVINTFAKETVNINVNKIWNDGDDKDGIRPAELKVWLLADGKTTGDSIILNAVNGWQGSFSELDKYREDGERISYTVSETSVFGYTATVSGDMETGYTLMNTHTPSKPDPDDPVNPDDPVKPDDPVNPDDPVKPDDPTNPDNLTYPGSTADQGNGGAATTVNGQGGTAFTPAINGGGAGDGSTPVMTLDDEGSPLAGKDDHKDCILHFLLAVATLIVLLIYTKRRKDIMEDIYEIEEKLAEYEEVRK